MAVYLTADELDYLGHELEFFFDGELNTYYKCDNCGATFFLRSGDDKFYPSAYQKNYELCSRKGLNELLNTPCASFVLIQALE